ADRRALRGLGRLDYGAALTEADPRCAVSLAMRAEDDGVAVIQEGAGLAARQARGLASAFVQSHQTSERARLAARHRAAAEEITGLEIAAVRSVMRHELRDGPVH